MIVAYANYYLVPILSHSTNDVSPHTSPANGVGLSVACGLLGRRSKAAQLLSRPRRWWSLSGGSYGNRHDDDGRAGSVTVVTVNGRTHTS